MKAAVSRLLSAPAESTIVAISTHIQHRNQLQSQQINVGNASNTAANTIEFALFLVDKDLIHSHRSLSLLQCSFPLSCMCVSLYRFL